MLSNEAGHWSLKLIFGLLGAVRKVERKVCRPERGTPRRQLMLDPPKNTRNQTHDPLIHRVVLFHGSFDWLAHPSD
jgi:hypothetical protein